MPIPKLYSVLPLNGDSPDPSLLTNHSSGIVDGSVGEKYAVLSYFPEELKFSLLNDFVVNKYVLFVLEGEEYADYRAEWNCKLIQDGEQVQLKATQVHSPHNFEFTVAISPETFPYQESWELTLKTTCNLFKDDSLEHTFELEHQLKPIEADLLSGNGASFEDETGDFDATNSSVFLGHEATSHFVRGHFCDYLIEKKSNEITASGNELNNAGTFVHQAAAIAYIKSLTAITEFGVVLEEPVDEFASQNLSYDLDGPFNKLLSHKSLETAILTDGELDIDMIRNIGVFDLNLHHALPLTFGESNVRVGTSDNLLNKIKELYTADSDEFIRAYHRCVFPKSAVELSVGIFDSLLAGFQAEEVDDLIYHTFEESLEDKKAKITDWKELEYSELRDKGNDDFMKNLISEYYLGYFDGIDAFMIRQINPKQILRIDWSQFIQKILSPSSISVPFTLIKIQVNDLRSGKPLRHALISKLEFFSSDPEIDDSLLPLFLPSEFRYSYEVKAPFDAGIPFETSDSKIKRVQKICRAMGYYKEAIDGIYDNATRIAMHAYLKSEDRELPSPMDLPESASEAHMNAKKDAWIDFIIQDFEANCLTDADGVLNCQIPDQLLENRKLTINVGFSEFAIIREALAGEESSSMSDKPLIRPESDDGDLATRFVAQWDGDPHALIVNPNEQNTNWEDNIADKNFGWKIMNAEETREDYLKVALPLEVKRTTTEDINKLKISFGFITDYHSEYTTDDISHFSPFLEDTGVHFVVYGMQWCQPLMDNLLEDSGNSQRTRIDEAIITRKDNEGNWIKNRQMHIVSKNYGGNLTPTAPEPKSYGQYYAFYDRNPHSHEYRGAGRVHDSTDIYTRSDGETTVFSILFGKFIDYNSGSFGNDCFKVWFYFNGKKKEIVFAHTSSREALNNKIVLPGQKLGVTGRGGTSFSTNEPSHLHLQMLDGHTGTHVGPSNRTSIEPAALIRDTDPENSIVLPTNKLPIMLPCHCHYGSKSRNTEVQGCKGGSEGIAQTCWALIKFPEYDHKTSRTHDGHDDYHEFPEKLVDTRDNNKHFFACSYILKKPTTTLSSALTDTGSESSITVNNSAEFSNKGALLINDELITYTSNDRATNTFGGCKRAQKSTTKGNHLTTDTIHYLNFNNYYVQAHLKYFFENNGKPSIPNLTVDPGAIDNSISNSLRNVTINLTKDDAISVLNSEDGFSEIEKGGVSGWVEDHLIDDRDGSPTINKALTTVLNSKVSSSSLRAIYDYMRIEDELSYTDYKSNFDISVKLVKALRNNI